MGAKMNIKGLIDHYEMMLRISKTDVQREFYKRQLRILKEMLDKEQNR